MSKVIELPKKPSTNVVPLETARKRNYVFDLVKHRQKLLALQAEIKRVKRSLLRMVKDDGTPG